MTLIKQRPYYDKGFQLFENGFCDTTSCEKTMPEVYYCPACGSTFCNGCTDLQAWKDDLHCPQCGVAPSVFEPEGFPTLMTSRTCEGCSTVMDVHLIRPGLDEGGNFQGFLSLNFEVCPHCGTRPSEQARLTTFQNLRRLYPR